MTHCFSVAPKMPPMLQASTGTQDSQAGPRKAAATGLLLDLSSSHTQNLPAPIASSLDPHPLVQKKQPHLHGHGMTKAVTLANPPTPRTAVSSCPSSSSTPHCLCPSSCGRCIPSRPAYCTPCLRPPLLLCSLLVGMSSPSLRKQLLMPRVRARRSSPHDAWRPAQ